MSEALWAQIISGFFGLASVAIGTYLPHRLRRTRDNTPPTPPTGTPAAPLAAEPEATA